MCPLWIHSKGPLRLPCHAPHAPLPCHPMLPCYAPPCSPALVQEVEESSDEYLQDMAHEGVLGDPDWGLVQVGPGGLVQVGSCR